MNSKGILPNNEAVKEALRANALKQHREEEPEDDEKIEDYVDVKVREMKSEFIEYIVGCGFDRADVEYLVEKRGVHSMDKYILIEELNTIKFNRGREEDARKLREKKTRSR